MTLLHDTAALTCWRAKRSKIKLSPKGKCYFKVLATWGKTRPDFNKPSWRFGAKIVPHKMSHGMSNKWSIEPLSRIFDDVERSYWAKFCSVKLLLLSLLRRKPKGLHRWSAARHLNANFFAHFSPLHILPRFELNAHGVLTWNRCE